MKLSELKSAYPPVPADIRQNLVRTAHTLQEDRPMKKKPTFVLAFVLVLLAATAAAVTLRYSVEKAVPPKYADKITTIDQHYENQWYTLDINDAVSDGMRMVLAMHFEPKAGADPVLIFPRLEARAGDTKLYPDPESGYEYLDGFWMPEMTEGPAGPGNAMLDMVLLEEDVPDQAAIKEDITWTLTLHTLKPRWPLEHDTYTSKGYFESGGLTEEEHSQLFRDAYKNEKILLTYGDNTLEYSWYLPVPEGMSEEEYMLKRDWERLVLSGSFEEVDRSQCEFSTKGNAELKQAQPGQIAPMEGFDVQVQSVQVGFLGCAYDLLLLHPEGTSDWKESRTPPLYFEVRAGDTRLNAGGYSFDSSGASLPQPNAQQMRGNFSIEGLDKIPDEITFVPFTIAEGEEYLKLNAEEGQQRFYQEDKAFTVKLY